MIQCLTQFLNFTLGTPSAYFNNSHRNPFLATKVFSRKNEMPTQIKCLQWALSSARK